MGGQNDAAPSHATDEPVADSKKIRASLRTAFERGGEMGRRMAELDWATSPLGPPGEWPDELVSAVGTMLASGAQIIIFFGPEYCALYNDAYIQVTGSKHPTFLGQPARSM